MLQEAIDRLSAWDLPFAGIKGDLPTRSSEALKRLFELPHYEHAAKVLQLPHRDWPSIGRRLQELTVDATGHLISPDEAERMVEVSEADCDDPLAACIIALFAVAAWEGVTVDVESQKVSRGWWLVAHLLDRLLDLDAVWSADLIARRGIDVIQADPGFRGRRDLVDLLARFRRVRQRIDARYARAIGEFAWELRRAAGDQDVRTQVAVLAWTLGDVAHAALLSIPDTALSPVGVFRTLIHMAVIRIPDDPLVQRAMAVMGPGKPGTIHKRHPLLFHRIGFGVGTQIELDAAAVFVRTLRAHLESAPFDRSELGRLVMAAREGMQDKEAPLARLVRRQPSSLIRIESLVALVGPRDEAGRTWQEIATLAAWFLKMQRVTELHDFHDLALDIPLYYLGQEGADVETALWAAEVHRCANLTYSLDVIRPPAESTVLGNPTFGEEADLLADLRGAHLAARMNDLPLAYRRNGKSFASKGTPPPQRLDSPRRVGESIARTRDKWGRVLDRLETVDRVYVRRRRSPGVTPDEVPELLGTTTRPGAALPGHGSWEPRSGVRWSGTIGDPPPLLLEPNM